MSNECMSLPPLKPCPFCGSLKLKVECKSKLAGWTGIDARVAVETYSVRCNVCHSRGGTASGKVITSHRHIYRDKMPEWATEREALKKLSFDKWNRRAGESNG